MSSSQTNAAAVNHHHRNNKTNAKVVQRTTSESLRLSMNSNCIDGNVLANGNSNCSSGLTSNVVGPISNNLQSTQTILPSTATLLMTNNGKFQSNSTSTAFVTLPDINMDLKPKTSSYQITSITVGTRTSADEDSADDLDESHTTDENSRITDMENETPSYSEDSNMYSKDDVFATAYAHGIPIMQNNMSADLSNCVNSNQVGKKLPDVRVNCVTAAVDKNKGVEIKGSERFKVVKIESIEPFKRGRWTCMDYLDQSAKQVQMNFGGNGKNVSTNDSGVVLTDNFTDSATSSTSATTTKQKKQGKTVQTEILPNQNQNVVPNAHLISGQSAPCATPVKTNDNSSPGQTMQQPLQNNFTNVNVVNAQNVQSTPVLQSNIIQQHQQLQAQQKQQIQQQPPQQQPQPQPQQHQTQPVNSFHHPVATHTVQQGQSLPHQIMSHAIPQMQQNHQMQGTPNAVQHQMAISHGQLPNFQPQQHQQQQQQQQYSNSSMGGSQSAHNTQTIPMQQIHEIHQYQQQYQNNMQNQQAAQQYYGQMQTDNTNTVYQKPQMQQQQQPQYQQMQQFSGQYQQQMPSNQQQFQSQTTMPAQQIPMQSQQSQVSYPHGQTLPANALQGIVSTGTHMTGLPITSQIPPTMVNVTHQQAMSMGHLPNNIELNMNIPTGMNPMAVNHSGYIQQQQQVPHSQQAQMHSHQTPIVSSSVHIQPQNQSYANQNQTIASNVAAVPYSIAIKATHDSSVMQQATNQMHNVNQSNVNLQSNYVNPTVSNQQTQPTSMVQQPGIVQQPIQVTPQQNVMTNPNRNNVISSETGNAAQNLNNVNASSSMVTNIAPVASNTNNVNANISIASGTNANNDPDTVSVDGPTKMPVVNATATDDVQSVDESESNSNELDSRIFVLPLNEINLESTDNVYTNMVMQNPLENPTVTSAIRTNEPYTSTSNNFIAQNTNSQYAINVAAQQPMSYTTQSLTSPIKGIIPKLQREESERIPIPGRAQSHDDIRMLGTGSGYNTPNSSYCISPNSPRGQYMYGSSPMGSNLSPPIRGGFTVARRALSRATSPLSSSVPSSYNTNLQPNKISSSTNTRNLAVNNNCSSASGTSAVAIDNKIEQAMDLVKSHLMFAVREEVEVLKEKISELMDRINTLEVENTILKANASQETLTKLTTAAPTKTTHTATNSNPQNGPIS